MGLFSHSDEEEEEERRNRIVYLKYGDLNITLRDSDVIKSGWLTDNVLAFWQEYIEREQLIAFPRASIILLRPSIAYLLIAQSDPLALKEALPSFATTTHVFIPINDNPDVQNPDGGNHWSLLLVSIIDGVAFHYDSANHTNRAEAENTTRKMQVILGKPLRFIAMNDSPQQRNGDDCGVFVCILTSHLLLKRLLRADASKKVSMSMGDVHIDSMEGRRTINRVLEAERMKAEREEQEKERKEQEEERKRARSHSPTSGSSKGLQRVEDELATGGRRSMDSRLRRAHLHRGPK